MEESVISDQPKQTSPATKSIETNFVKFQQALVHCGPSKEYYTTGTLTRGEAVQVHHRTADGWCAITPPKGSHSWLVAEQAYLLPGGKRAEVVGEKTPAWIGSESDGEIQRFRWQVALQPGQQVEVIGELEQAIDSDKIRLWYKIMPPTGEYRWIRSEALTKDPPPVRQASTSPRTNNPPANVSIVQPAVAQEVHGKESSPVPIPDPIASPPVEVPNSTTPSIGQDGIQIGTIDRAPAVGEYIEGEGVVVQSLPAPWEGQSAMPLHADHDDSILDETIVDSQVMAGEMIMDDDALIADGSETLWIDEGTGVCQNCQHAGCTTCDASHQTDGIDYWNSMQQAPCPPPIRYRPLSRLLGLIGLSIVEGEQATGPICTGQSGCGCDQCRQTIHDLKPRDSGRFSHLPRPTPRYSRTAPKNWLSDITPAHRRSSLLEERLQPRFDSVYEPGLSELSDQVGRRRSGPVDDWQGIATARLSPELGNIDSKGSSWVPRPADELSGSSVLTTGVTQDELRFSTPELQRVMNELTRMVAEPMALWNLETLTLEAQRWVEQGGDAIARGEARLLLERIEEFEQLRRRSMGLPQNAVALSANPSFGATNFITPITSNSPVFDRISVPSHSVGFQRPIDAPPVNPLNTTTNASSAQPVNPMAFSGPAVQRNADGSIATDASGWLVEVFSAQPGQPNYALTDDYGGLIAYVQPSPGMNLRRYLKQPVGIYGMKGYLPQLSARQIVAERIVRIR